MSEGRLGSVGSTIAATLVQPYFVPSTAVSATVKIHMCNTATGPAKVRIAFSLSATTPSLGEYQYYDSIIPANGGTLTDDCRLLSTGEYIHILSDIAGVTYRVEGIEQPV